MIGTMASVIRRVVVGMSGGVDSSVTALLLKRKGFDVVGVFMENWDVIDETGHCPAAQDFQDAEEVCHKLEIPLRRVNFVKEYWNNVFSNLLSDYEAGYTPNPDIRCNERIKFSPFFDYARNELSADAVATGHYANTSFGSYLEHFCPNVDARLLKARDSFKDQTFFLSRIPQRSLRRAMFPLGKYLKKEVVEIAREYRLGRVAQKKESTGICFVGRRRFQDFIGEYVEDKPGNFVDLDSGSIVGTHKGIHYWTIGQRCRISGVPDPFFVFRKDSQSNDIIVVRGTSHPALYSSLIFGTECSWISSHWVHRTERNTLECEFRFQHTKPLTPCMIFRSNRDVLIIHLARPLRALTPGQFAVLYLKDECLGSARIIHSGPSLYTLNKQMRTDIDSDREIEDVGLQKYEICGT